MLIVLGFITMAIGILIVAYGMWITRPEAGIAKEVFWGVTAGVFGLVMMILGGLEKTKTIDTFNYEIIPSNLCSYMIYTFRFTF
jgi:hypothetical protein